MERGPRETHQIRAYAEEYDLIKRWIYMTRKNPSACRKILDFLETEVPIREIKSKTAFKSRDQHLTNVSES